MSLFNFFSIGANVSWDKYNTKGEFYSHQMDQFTVGIEANAVYKDFTLWGGYAIVKKQLWGELANESEPKSTIGIAYNKNNLKLNISVYRLFLTSAQYTSERLTEIAPMKRHVYIKDNDSMLMFGLSYSFNSGKRGHKINRRLNNTDFNNSIMKVSE